MSDKISVTIDSDLEDLIPGFLENRKTDLEKLRTAAGGKDFKTIQLLGHSLKGVGGGYGFERISEIGAALEEAGKNASLDAANEQINQLNDYMSRLEIVFE
ncbi:MAG: Hpt domain-containing protein [Gammaproteobacteria bacterium]